MSLQLIAMEIILPQFGLFFWTVVVFLTVFFLMRKFAWKPILAAIQEREDDIDSKLQAAAEAEKQMKELTAQNEQILAEARLERDKIVRDANTVRDQIIAEARKHATDEADKLVANARDQIKLEQNAAISAMRKEAADLALIIAEKVLRKKLENSKEEEAFVKELVANVKLN